MASASEGGLVVLVGISICVVLDKKLYSTLFLSMGIGNR